MSEILLFTKPGCQKCDWVKERIPEGVKVNVINMETATGMAEAAYYELLSKHTPILVVDDEVFEGAIKIVEKITSCSGNGIEPIP